MRIWVLAAAVMLTGCLQTTDDYPTATLERLPVPDMDFDHVIVADHGAPGLHTVRSLHEGNHLLELAGWNDLTDKLPPEAQGTGWSALGLWKNFVCIAQFTGSGSIAIVDISDPAAPEVVSHTSDLMVNGDCEFTEDGNYLFAGSYLGADPGMDVDASGVPIAERGTPVTEGINVWDVTDKANPQHMFFSQTGNYHTHQLHTDDEGTVWVVQAYSGNIYRFDPNADDLELVSTRTPMVHDMWIQKHPITGTTLLVSGAGSGFVIYDFDDPSDPVELVQWAPPEDIARAEGWHRQAISSVLIDGRAIMVVSGETCGSGETRPYLVIDITEVAEPKTMGSWEMPGLPVSTDAQHLCEMSSHEFALYDGYLATGNYHAGIWLIDIGSAERLREPATLGYYIPSEEPATGGSAQDLTWPWNPFVWGAEFDERGYIVAADASSGLYVLEVPGVSG